MTIPPENPPSDHPATESSYRFNPWLFFGALLAPALLTFLGLMTIGGAAIYAPVVAAIPAGLVCGIHIAKVPGNLSSGGRWAMGIVSVLGCAAVACVIGFGGCLLGLGLGSGTGLLE